MTSDVHRAEDFAGNLKVTFFTVNFRIAGDTSRTSVAGRAACPDDRGTRLLTPIERECGRAAQTGGFDAGLSVLMARDKGQYGEANVSFMICCCFHNMLFSVRICLECCLRVVLISASRKEGELEVRHQSLYTKRAPPV